MDNGNLAIMYDDIESLSEEQLARVESLTFKNSDLSSFNTDKLLLMTSLREMSIMDMKIDDVSFINKVTSDFHLIILGSEIDFSSLKNDHITAISFGDSRIHNAKKIESLTNLKSIGYSETFIDQEIDFSTFSGLESAAIADYHDSFADLVASLPDGLKSLSFGGTNIQNKDSSLLKKFTNLEELNLVGTYLTDIDFITSMQNLKRFSAPYAVVDLSPIRNLPNLEYINWDAYTELNVDQELVDYLDEKHVSHPTYHSDVRAKVEAIIDELELDNDDNNKTKLRKLATYLVEHTGTEMAYNRGLVPYGETSLDSLLYYHQGVCQHHMVAMYTISKMAGINDIYGVVGILHNEINTWDDYGTTTESYSLDMFEAHAWNIYFQDKKAFGIDAAQMNIGTGTVVNFDENFWKNPFKDSEYSLDYAAENYVDYNYLFSLRHEQIGGLLGQEMTYEFSNIDDLDIVNHIIYSVDANDNNATSICSKVLTNYTCRYVDSDNSGNMTSGDKIEIFKGDKPVDSFGLSVESWTEPAPEPWLGKMALSYLNYPNAPIENNTLTTKYYNSENPLAIVIKGKNFVENTYYGGSIKVYNDKFEMVHEQPVHLLGKDINSGTTIAVEYVMAPKPLSNSQMGTTDNMISLFINGMERNWAGFYIEEADDENESPTNGLESGDPNQDKNSSSQNVSNPKTADTTALTILSLASFMALSSVGIRLAQRRR